MTNRSACFILLLCGACSSPAARPVMVRHAVARDTSRRLSTMPVGAVDNQFADDADHQLSLSPPFQGTQPAPPPPVITTPAGSERVEQLTMGSRPAAILAASFDGLGSGFVGPQGSAVTRNPSDNTLAVGPNHIVQIVNSRMAIFTKRGQQFDSTGRVLYGPVATNNVFRGFGGACEAHNNGDAVVRYDQLADRWLIVMPIFTRLPPRDTEPPAGRSGEPALRSMRGRRGQPGAAERLYEPSPTPPVTTPPPGRGGRGTPA